METVLSDVEYAAPRPARRWGVIALHCALFVVLVVALHVGFQASDDIQYLDGALGWIHSFPYVGDNHWTLRHTVTIPTAVFISLFGLNEISASLTNILYFAAFLAVNAAFMSKYLGWRAASLATVLLMTMPGFTVVATYLNPDIPELFFATTAFWLWYSATEDDRRWRWIACGVLAGVAFVNRQTAAAFPLFLGMVFLWRPSSPRSRYIMLAAAFLLVVAGEWGYLTTLTGDPAYRYRIDFNHDPVDRFAEAARIAKAGGWIDKEGMLSVNVFLDPLLNLIITQKYAFAFWLAIPAFGAVLRSARTENRRLLLAVAGFAATSFLFVALNPKLYLVPRYFVIAAWGAVVIAAWWLTGLWAAGRRKLTVAITGVALLANMAALSVEETNPRMIERALVHWVEAHPGQTIHTDIETAERARYYFRFAGLPENYSTDKPPSGALFFYSDSRVKQCAAMARCRARAADFVPSSGWRAEETIALPHRRVLGPLVEWLHIDRVLPRDVANRIRGPITTVVVYRVP